MINTMRLKQLYKNITFPGTQIDPGETRKSKLSWMIKR